MASRDDGFTIGAELKSGAEPGAKFALATTSSHALTDSRPRARQIYGRWQRGERAGDATQLLIRRAGEWRRRMLYGPPALLSFSQSLFQLRDRCRDGCQRRKIYCLFSHNELKEETLLRAKAAIWHRPARKCTRFEHCSERAVAPTVKIYMPFFACIQRLRVLFGSRTDACPPVDSPRRRSDKGARPSASIDQVPGFNRQYAIPSTLRHSIRLIA